MGKSDSRDIPSHVIVQVKDGVASNLACLAFIVCLCAFVIWWGTTHDRVLLLVAPIFCIVWLYVGYVCVRNIRHPKSAMLAVEGDRLIWKLHNRESQEEVAASIILKSIATIEFVLPQIRFENKLRHKALAQLFVVDVHGNRRQLPEELWPGVYQKRISIALKQYLPNIQIIERFDES